MTATNANKPWSRRIAALACVTALCLGGTCLLIGCSSEKGGADASNPDAGEIVEMRKFTDSLGRVVEVPAAVERIAPSGHTAQQVLITMAPDMMVGLSEALRDDQLKYLGQDMAAKPVFGTAFGSKGSMNKEALAAAMPQVIIDTGEATNGLLEDLDALQDQLGIPVVFLETPLDDYATAYRMLGDLLGMEERGEELASYCENAYAEVENVMASIPQNERVNLAYLMGDAGLNALAKGSYQGGVIDLCANNVVVVDNPSSKSLGNEISLEQIAVWDPEVIVFNSDSAYETLIADSAWANISAIKNGRHFEVPSSPYIWLNSPATVNQVLGMQWLPRALYPEAFDNDMKDVVTGYYKTFYGYELTDADYAELMENALP